MVPRDLLWRFPVMNSEVGYLGYQAAEAYGLSYKVRYSP